MKDYLLDIVTHTLPLGCIDTVKVTGDDDNTLIEAVADDRTVVMIATFNQPHASFKGIFGLPNLNTLNTILNIPEYKENGRISLAFDKEKVIDVPCGLEFENADGSFNNSYRFMPTAYVNKKIPGISFRGATWDVELVPAQAAIQRFKFQASATSEETVFVAKTDGTDLKFYFGDPSTHAGDFVFESNVKGALPRGCTYSVARCLAILGLPGDKTIKISDGGGVILITLDSGLVTYDFYALALTK